MPICLERFIAVLMDGITILSRAIAKKYQKDIFKFQLGGAIVYLLDFPSYKLAETFPFYITIESGWRFDFLPPVTPQGPLEATRSEPASLIYVWR